LIAGPGEPSRRDVGIPAIRGGEFAFLRVCAGIV
jgi:hypothetical protein